MTTTPISRVALQSLGLFPYSYPFTIGDNPTSTILSSKELSQQLFTIFESAQAQAPFDKEGAFTEPIILPYGLPSIIQPIQSFLTGGFRDYYQQCSYNDDSEPFRFLNTLLFGIADKNDKNDKDDQDEKINKDVKKDKNDKTTPNDVDLAQLIRLNSYPPLNEKCPSLIHHILKTQPPLHTDQLRVVKQKLSQQFTLFQTLFTMGNFDVLNTPLPNTDSAIGVTLPQSILDHISYNKIDFDTLGIQINNDDNVDVVNESKPMKEELSQPVDETTYVIDSTASTEQEQTPIIEPELEPEPEKKSGGFWGFIKSLFSQSTYTRKSNSNSSSPIIRNNIYVETIPNRPRIELPNKTRLMQFQDLSNSFYSYFILLAAIIDVLGWDLSNDGNILNQFNTLEECEELIKIKLTQFILAYFPWNGYKSESRIPDVDFQSLVPDVPSILPENKPQFEPSKNKIIIQIPRNVTNICQVMLNHAIGYHYMLPPLRPPRHFAIANPLTCISVQNPFDLTIKYHRERLKLIGQVSELPNKVRPLIDDRAVEIKSWSYELFCLQSFLWLPVLYDEIISRQAAIIMNTNYNKTSLDMNNNENQNTFQFQYLSKIDPATWPKHEYGLFHETFLDAYLSRDSILRPIISEQDVLHMSLESFAILFHKHITLAATSSSMQYDQTTIDKFRIPTFADLFESLERCPRALGMNNSNIERSFSGLTFLFEGTKLIDNTLSWPHYYSTLFKEPLLDDFFCLINGLTYQDKYFDENDEEQDGEEVQLIYPSVKWANEDSKVIPSQKRQYYLRDNTYVITFPQTTLQIEIFIQAILRQQSNAVLMMLFNTLQDKDIYFPKLSYYVEHTYNQTVFVSTLTLPDIFAIAGTNSYAPDLVEAVTKLIQ